MRLASLLLPLVAFSASSVSGYQPALPAFCTDEYNVAVFSTAHQLTAAEQQAVANCEDSALRYYLTATLHYPATAMSVLPEPSGRSLTPLEAAFRSLHEQRGQVVSEGSVAGLIAAHGAAGVTVAFVLRQGESSPSIDAWFDARGTSEFVRKMACGGLCAALTCLPESRPPLEAEMAALVSNRCPVSSMFDLLEPPFADAAYALATNASTDNAVAMSMLFALRAHGDARVSNIPAPSGIWNDILATNPITSVNGRIREYTSVRLLRRAFGRLQSL